MKPWLRFSFPIGSVFGIVSPGLFIHPFRPRLSVLLRSLYFLSPVLAYVSLLPLLPPPLTLPPLSLDRASHGWQATPGLYDDAAVGHHVSSLLTGTQ